jgi:hypothetical protein
MLTWPSIGATRLGQWLGRLIDVKVARGRLLSPAPLLAALTIPVSLGLYIWKLMPGVYRRYRLTDRRIVVDRGLRLVEERGLGLEEFDSIEIVVLPGQQWLRCGEVVFRCRGREVFRLSGVPRPIPFREVCLKAQTAFLAVRQVLQEQRSTQQ